MIKATFKNVILKKEEENNLTTSGIILDASYNKDLNIGKIINIGEKCELNKEFLKDNNKVIFGNNFKKITYNNETFYIVNEEEIFAIIK